MKKKILVIIFVGILVLGITGCGSNKVEENNSSLNNKTETSDNSKNESNKEDNQADNSQKIDGKYVYMISENNMLVGNVPSKFGNVYSTPEEAMEAFGHNVFVRHTIENDEINNNNIKALDRSIYGKNKEMIKELFGKDRCVDSTTAYSCSNDNFVITLYDDGYVMVQEVSNKQTYCFAKSNLAKCKSY